MPDPRVVPQSRARLLLPVFIALTLQISATWWQIAAVDGGPRGLFRGEGLGYARTMLAFGFAIAGPLVLLGARRWPGPVVAVTMAIAVLDVLTEPDILAPFFAAAFAIILAMVRGARVWAFVSVAAAWVLGVAGLAVVGIAWHPGRIVATTLGMLAALGAGEFVRTRRAVQQEHRRQAEVRRVSAAEQERVRIARELHDVLAHSLSQINVQAGVALHLMPDNPQAAEEALVSIKAVSKDALQEVRGVLGALRAGPEGQVEHAPHFPQPGLAELGDLVEGTRRAGIVSTLRRDTPSAVPNAAQHAIYRIVQEALTNVMRHSAARNVTVVVEERGGGYDVVVEDDGRGGVPDFGNGLLGMNERATLLGGRLQAGPVPGGGFRVSAHLPRQETGEKIHDRGEVS